MTGRHPTGKCLVSFETRPRPRPAASHQGPTPKPLREVLGALSAENELLAFHDATLERTTNGHGPVAERTLGQLLGLDAGSGFQDAAGKLSFRGQGITIPALRELVESLPQVTDPEEARTVHSHSLAMTTAQT